MSTWMKSCEHEAIVTELRKQLQEAREGACDLQYRQSEQLRRAEYRANHFEAQCDMLRGLCEAKEEYVRFLRTELKATRVAYTIGCALLIVALAVSVLY